MNDIYKTNIKARLDQAMAGEGLRPSETARIFDVPPAYISLIRNPDTWKYCPNTAWETATLWINSGQSLKEYSLKHGRVLPQQQQSTHNPVPEKPIIIEEKPEPTLVDPPQLNSSPAPEIFPDEKENTIRITPGIRHELINELQLRGDRLRDELTAITKLLEQYI